MESNHENPPSFVDSKKCLADVQTSTPSSQTLNADSDIEKVNEKDGSVSCCNLTSPVRLSTEEMMTAIRIDGFEDGSSAGEKLIKLTVVAGVIHFENVDNASSDEVTFLSSLAFFGPNGAIDLATKLQWQCQRPLQALLAVWSESGKNCTKQSTE